MRPRRPARRPARPVKPRLTPAGLSAKRNYNLGRRRLPSRGDGPAIAPERRNDQSRKMRDRSINTPPGHPPARKCRIASTATGTTATTALSPGSGNREVQPPGRSGRPGRVSDRRPGKVVTCPGRLPGAAAVTLPKDLLLTDRVVIITLCYRQRLVAGFRSAACPITERSRSGRYAITCNVITWQWITKVSPQLSA